MKCLKLGKGNNDIFINLKKSQKAKALYLVLSEDFHFKTPMWATFNKLAYPCSLNN